LNLPFIEPGSVLGRTGLLNLFLQFCSWYRDDCLSELAEPLKRGSVRVQAWNALDQARSHWPTIPAAESGNADEQMPHRFVINAPYATLIELCSQVGMSDNLLDGTPSPAIHANWMLGSMVCVFDP
jgi:hypothetical protein